jgi:cell division protein ZapB
MAHEPPSLILFDANRGLKPMPNSEISNLEQRINELIALCDQLSNENSLMRGRQNLLVEERARLIEKTELARSRVEAMLVRLKAMEVET